MQNELFEKTPVHKAYFSFALPVVFSMVIFILSKTVGYYGVLSAQPVSDFITAVVAIVLVRSSVYREIRE